MQTDLNRSGVGPETVHFKQALDDADVADLDTMLPAALI